MSRDTFIMTSVAPHVRSSRRVYQVRELETHRDDARYRTSRQIVPSQLKVGACWRRTMMAVSFGEWKDCAKSRQQLAHRCRIIWWCWYCCTADTSISRILLQLLTG